MLLHDYLVYYAQEKPDNTFAELGGATLSYFQANRRANQFAQSLLTNGLKKGRSLRLYLQKFYRFYCHVFRRIESGDHTGSPELPSTEMM